MDFGACPRGLAQEQISSKRYSFNGAFGDAAEYGDANVHVEELFRDESGAEFGIANVSTNLHRSPPGSLGEVIAAMRAQPKRSMETMAPVLWFSIISALTTMT